LLKMHKLLNKSQVKVILEIFKNPGINLREIITNTKLSPNFVSDYVNDLIKREMLTEEKLEKKRVYLRRFFLNFDSTTTQHFFKLIKEEEKESFFEKYPKLKSVFNQLKRELESEFILVYGSYARMHATKESDIDVLIVGNFKNKEKIREIFVSLDIDVSLKVESLKDFEKKKNDALHQQILKEAVVIFDGGRYFEEMFSGGKR